MDLGLNVCGVLDLEFCGPKFTWINPSGTLQIISRKAPPLLG